MIKDDDRVIALHVLGDLMLAVVGAGLIAGVVAYFMQGW